MCPRVRIRIGYGTRLGFTASERRVVKVRFLAPVEGLRDELSRVAKRRGAASKRAADDMDPIELVFADPDLGDMRLVGRVDPPEARHGIDDVSELDFGIREQTLQPLQVPTAATLPLAVKQPGDRPL